MSPNNPQSTKTTSSDPEPTHQQSPSPAILSLTTSTPRSHHSSSRSASPTPSESLRLSTLTHQLSLLSTANATKTTRISTLERSLMYNHATLSDARDCLQKQQFVIEDQQDEIQALQDRLYEHRRKAGWVRRAGGDLGRVDGFVNAPSGPVGLRQMKATSTTVPSRCTESEDGKRQEWLEREGRLFTPGLSREERTTRNEEMREVALRTFVDVYREAEREAGGVQRTSGEEKERDDA